MAIHLVQLDDDLWVNPNEIVAVYSDEGLTCIATALNEFEVLEQSVAAVVGRLSEYIHTHEEE